MTALKFYKKEKEIIKQLFDLGLISDVERISKNAKNKYLYMTQVKESK